MGIVANRQDRLVMFTHAPKGVFARHEFIATAAHEERFGEHLGHIVMHGRQGNEQCIT